MVRPAVFLFQRWGWQSWQVPSRREREPLSRCKPRSATGDFLRCLLLVPLEVTRRWCPRATSGLVSPCRQRVWQAIGQHLSETYRTLSMLSIFSHASKQSECEHSCFEVEISVYLLVLLACFTEFTMEILSFPNSVRTFFRLLICHLPGLG